MKIKYGDFIKYWREAEKEIPYSGDCDKNIGDITKASNIYERYCFGMVDFETAIKILLYSIEKYENGQKLFTDTTPSDLAWGCAVVYKTMSKNENALYSPTAYYKLCKNTEDGILLHRGQEQETKKNMYLLYRQFAYLFHFEINRTGYLRDYRKALENVLSMNRRLRIGVLKSTPKRKKSRLMRLDRRIKSGMKIRE